MLGAAWSGCPTLPTHSAGPPSDGMMGLPCAAFAMFKACREACWGIIDAASCSEGLQEAVEGCPLGAMPFKQARPCFEEVELLAGGLPDSMTVGEGVGDLAGIDVVRTACLTPIATGCLGS